MKFLVMWRIEIALMSRGVVDAVLKMADYAMSVPYLVSGAIVDTADGPIIFGISREIASHKRMEQEVIAARGRAGRRAGQVRVSLLCLPKTSSGAMRRGACTRGSPEGASGRENRVGLLWMRTCGSRVVDYIKACARRPACAPGARWWNGVGKIPDRTC
jgi:hypothetical protein